MAKSKKVNKVKKEKKTKETAAEKLGDLFQMQAYGLMDIPHIEMIGNREMLIENCKGIIEYGDEQIRLNTGRYILKLQGRNLSLINMSDEDLLIRGFIMCIEFVI
ncbi:hypothetical protein SDC9_204343 [bioreactor metagenome]|uniref:Sporulation protein YqfC n=1 Tax=bioreactor metagenome TaxID=1076179 RepID=A0A645JAW8_9ZZZZ